METMSNPHIVKYISTVFEEKIIQVPCFLYTLQKKEKTNK